MWRCAQGRRLPALALLLGLLVLGPAAAVAMDEPEGEPCRHALLTECRRHDVLETDRPNYLAVGKVPGPPRFEGQSDEEYELALQFSARMHPTALVPLYIAYTQRSYYLFSCCSSPFRAHVFNPALYLDLETNPAVLPPEVRRGWGLRGGRIGFEHESNGESKAEGRSVAWNRLFGELKIAYGVERPAWLDFTAAGPAQRRQRREPEFVTLRWKVWAPWTTSPGDTDLADFYGYTQLTLQLTTPAQQLSVSVRRGRLPDTTTTLMNYAFAPPAFLQANVLVLVQYFNGVGETLDQLSQRHTHWRLGIQMSR